MSFDAAPETGWPALMRRTEDDDPDLTFGATPDSVAAGTYGLIYLATPYNRIVRDAHGNWDRHLSVQAWEKASRAAAALCERGVTAISPIALSTDICATNARIDPLDQKFWTRWCEPLLQAADFVVVPDIPGWDASLGVWHEVTWALSVGTPVMVYAGGGVV